MIAVIFEVEPMPEHHQRYLDVAARLKPILEEIDGFISVERFQSLSNGNKILSLSFFEDEDALAKWRNTPAHRDAQKRGRAEIFKNYSLHVANVVRCYGMIDRSEVPADSLKVHDQQA